MLVTKENEVILQLLSSLIFFPSCMSERTFLPQTVSTDETAQHLKKKSTIAHISHPQINKLCTKKLCKLYLKIGDKAEFSLFN